MDTDEGATMIPAIHNGHGSTSDDFHRAGTGMMLGLVKKAAKRRTHAEQAWQDAIRDAVAAGASLRAVGQAAGISHVRVLQITRG